MSETLLSADPVAEPTATPEAGAEVPNSLLTPAPAEGESIQTAEGEWLLSSTVKGVGDAPEWFKAGKYGSVEAQAKAYTDLEGRFGSFTGAPENYEYKAPEGVDFTFDTEDPLYKGATELAKDLNMNQEGFEKMVGLYVNDMAGNQPDAQADLAVRLPEVLGANHAQVIDQVSGALSNMLDAETYEKVAPYASTPEAIALVNAVILATAPKVPPIDGGSNPSGVTKAKHNEMINAKTSTGEDRYNTDADYRKECDAYAAALYGED